MNAVRKLFPYTFWRPVMIILSNLNFVGRRANILLWSQSHIYYS